MQAMKASMPRASLNSNDDDDDRVEDSISGSEPNEDAFSESEVDEGDQSDAERDGNVCDYEDTELSVTEASHVDDLTNPGTKALVDPTQSDEVGCNTGANQFQ